MSDSYSLQHFSNEVADYIEAEYGDTNDLVSTILSDDERATIKNILDAHYHFNDSISNTANYVIIYLRESRKWSEENIHEN